MVATALINGRIIDGNGGPPVEDGAILIVDNLIEAVGTDVDIPPDAQVIDVQGKSLLPGMMDLHVHLRGPYHSLQKLRKSLLAGFTTIAHVAGTMPPASTDCRQAIAKTAGSRNVPGCWWARWWTAPTGMFAVG